MKKIKVLLSMLVLAAFYYTALAQDGYQVGDIAADFNLQNVDGEMVSLSGMEDIQGAIIIFTCNHCPFSKMYEKRIIKLQKKYAKKGYPVIAINPNDAVQYPSDSYENMQKRARKKGFNFPYLWDSTQDVAKAYGATRTPHVFLLQKVEDQFVVQYIGAIDDNAKNAKDVEEKYVAQAIEDLLSGKAVSTASTKAIGCSIKWKK